MVKERADLMYDFDFYVRNTIGDDDITDYWLMYGVPDEADYDDMEQIALDDEFWFSIVQAFTECCRRAKIYNIK